MIAPIMEKSSRKAITSTGSSIWLNRRVPREYTWVRFPIGEIVELVIKGPLKTHWADSQVVAGESATRAVTLAATRRANASS